MSLPPGLDAGRSAVLDRVAGLLDESVPGRFGALLVGHSAVTVQGRGWTSIQNGKLLALAAGEFDALLTADKGMAYQQIPLPCRPQYTFCMVDAQVAYLVQFSTSRPFTRSKSFTLFVTTMAPIARACAAIMRSAAPSWAPRFFKSARISA